MSWAAKRKALYFLGALLIVVLILIIPVYRLFHTTATCFDGIQNQGEEGVDCGGPCTALCRASELDPIVLWQQVFQITPGVYTAIAYVQNPNVNAEAFSVPYAFTFFDANSKLIGTSTGITLIPSGRQFSVIKTNISVARDIPTRTLFSFQGAIHWRVARPLPNIVADNILVSNVSTYPEVSASILNSSSDNLGQINVIAIVYDNSGNAFAASQTILDSLSQNSSVPVVFTWPRPFSNIVSHVEIIPIIQ